MGSRSAIVTVTVTVTATGIVIGSAKAVTVTVTDTARPSRSRKTGPPARSASANNIRRHRLNIQVSPAGLQARPALLGLRRSGGRSASTHQVRMPYYVLLGEHAPRACPNEVDPPLVRHPQAW